MYLVFGHILKGYLFVAQGKKAHTHKENDEMIHKKQLLSVRKHTIYAILRNLCT